MRIRGLGRLRVVAGKVQNRLSPGTVVLLYHRVADLPVDPLLLSVTPAHFEEHLQVIARIATPLSLRSLSDSLQSRTVTKHGVVVTFDDGAADNLHNAKPLLERYNIPATVFVATEYAKGEREFWWDELERIFLTPGKLPAELSINIDGKKSSWNITPDFSDARWNVLDTNTPTSRHQVYKELGESLRLMSTAERFAIIADLRQWSGLDHEPRESHRALSIDEIRQLASGGLVEIGAHTVTHPVLSAIPADKQEEEIKQSKLRLEEILDQPVESFAYPYGTRDDYNRVSVDLVKQMSFKCACSNFTGVVQPGTPPYELPRFVVRDWDGAEFERNLRGWFRG